MSRPKRTTKFSSIVEPLNLIELKALRNEVVSAIRILERKELQEKAMQKSRVIRDKIKIGQTISFYPGALGKNAIKGEVVGIFAEKIQILVDSRKRSVSLRRICLPGKS